VTAYTLPGREYFRARICERFRSPGIDSKETISPTYVAWRPGTITLFVFLVRQATQAGGIDSLESIPGLLQRLQIRALEPQDFLASLLLIQGKPSASEEFPAMKSKSPQVEIFAARKSLISGLPRISVRKGGSTHSH
jgi:hypothetical protein